MSEVFEGYEREFCELFADLSGKCMSARVLTEEEKKKRVSVIAGEMKEAEALMRKMDLETRSVQPSVKAILLEKIREHRNDLSNLKTELKRLGSSNTNQARAELLGSGGSNTVQGSAALRGRLATSTENLKRSADRIKVSNRTMLETGQIGASILQDLHQQHEPQQRANTTVHGVKDNADRSKKNLSGMSKRTN